MEESFIIKQKLEWKQQLKEACIQIIEQRIANSSAAITEAQESANSEEKSSAGDKYETSRAMGHLSQEMHSNQLEEARQELSIANSINTEVLHSKAGFGAAIVCKDFVLFIALGLGTVIVNHQKTVFLSPQAPLALALHAKMVNEKFAFNNKTIEILDVF